MKGNETTRGGSLLDRYILKEKRIAYCTDCASGCITDGCRRVSNCTCDTRCDDDSGC